MPFAAQPLVVRSSADGTSIGVFEVMPDDGGAGGRDREVLVDRDRRPPLLLVHGATADHTTWRAGGPRLAARRRVFAMDRRGRGASGDGPAYSIEREFADVASVADSLGPLVDVAGHSYGGRCGLGATLRTAAIRRVVVYEGAPAPPGVSYRPAGLVDAVRDVLARGDKEGALVTFLQGIVGMSEPELDAYRANPVWPDRVAAAHTILREVEAEATEAASIAALGRVSVPVLLILGSASRSPFRLGTDALAAQLADVQTARIEGAAHAAHHTHVGEFVRVVEAFLDRP